MGLLEDAIAEAPSSIDSLLSEAIAEAPSINKDPNDLLDAAISEAPRKPDFYTTNVKPEPTPNYTMEGLKGAAKGVFSKLPGSTVLSPVEQIPVEQRKYGNAALDFIARNEETLGSIATGAIGALTAGRAGVPGMAMFGAGQKVADIVKEKKKIALAEGLPEPSAIESLKEFGSRDALRAGVAGVFSGTGAAVGKYADSLLGKSLEKIGSQYAAKLFSDKATSAILKSTALYLGGNFVYDAVSSAAENEVDANLAGQKLTWAERRRNFILSLTTSAVFNLSSMGKTAEAALLKGKLESMHPAADTDASITTNVITKQPTIQDSDPTLDILSTMRDEAAIPIQQPVDPNRATLNKQSLMQHFKLSEEQASATEALVDAIGLDKNSIEVTTGGTPADDALMQERNAGFYSKLSKVVDERIKQAMSKEQLIRTLQNNGVKDEEIEWSDFDKLGKRITPEEVKEHLAENAVVVKDVVLEGGMTELDRLDARVIELEDRVRTGAPVHQELHEARIRRDELAQAWVRGRLSDDSPRYEEYTTGGGENYREHLFEVPKIGGDESARAHFGKKDIVAHARTKDRKLATGEDVLYIEEVQSDLHQRAADRQWNNGNRIGYTRAESKIREDLVRYGKLRSSEENLTQKELDLLDELSDSRRKPTDAPFKKTWPNLVLKKMIDTAVREGKQVVVWAPGDEQSIRYTGDEGSQAAKDRNAGLHEFYDKILPTLAENIVKPYGAKIETFDVPAHIHQSPDESKTVKAQGFRITDEMRRKVSGEGQPLFQNGKASVEFPEQGKALIRALSNPDVSSAVHEVAHIGRRFLFDKSLPVEVRKGITDDDIDIAETWAGARGGTWDTKAEERFARGFENYLREGKAPTSALTRIFSQFKEWLTSIYKNIVGTPLELKISPEMRNVFDRMVTRSERIVLEGKPLTQQYVARPNAVLPVELSKAKPRYSFGENKLSLSFSNDVDKAAYIVAANSKSKAHDKYVSWLTENMGWTELQSKAHGKLVKDELKKLAKKSRTDSIVVPPQSKQQDLRPMSVKEMLSQTAKVAQYNMGDMVDVGGKQGVVVKKQDGYLEVLVDGDQVLRPVGIDTVKPWIEGGGSIGKSKEAKEAEVLGKVAPEAEPTSGQEQGVGGGAPPLPPTPTTASSGGDMPPLIDARRSRLGFWQRNAANPITRFLTSTDFRAQLTKHDAVIGSMNRIYDANSDKIKADEWSREKIAAISSGLTEEQLSLVQQKAGRDIETTGNSVLDQRAEMLRDMFDLYRQQYIASQQRKLSREYPEEYAAELHRREDPTTPIEDIIEQNEADFTRYNEYLTKKGELEKWGFDNFITAIETGPVAIVAHYTDPQGNKLKQTVSFANDWAEARERIKTIWTNKEKLPFLGVVESFNAVDANNAPAPTKRRNDVLLGLGKFEERMNTYAHAMNKRIHFSDVEDYVKRSASQLRDEGHHDWADMVEEQMSFVKNPKDAFNELTNGVAANLASKYSRAAVRATLGLNISNDLIQIGSGLEHIATWHIRKGGLDAMKDAWSTISSSEAKQFFEQYEHRLGRTFATDADGHVSGRYTKSVIDSVLLAGMQIPDNMMKKFMMWSSYKYYKGQGLDDVEAARQAGSATRMTMFIDDISNTSGATRGSLGRAAFLMRRYLGKELEFMATLTPKQIVSHIGAQLAMFGPRLIPSIAKGMLFLNMWKPWTEKMDEIKEWSDEKFGNMSFGLSGATGLNFTDSATLRFPETFWDSGLFALGGALKIGAMAARDVAEEMGADVRPVYKKDWNDALSQSITMWRRISDTIDAFTNEDGAILDNKGKPIYYPDSMVEKAAPLIGMPIDKTRRDLIERNRQVYSRKRLDVYNGYKEEAIRLLSAGQPIPAELLSRATAIAPQMMENFGDTIASGVEKGKLPRELQTVLNMLSSRIIDPDKKRELMEELKKNPPPGIIIR